MSATIAPYHPGLAPELIALWNRALGERFPLDARLWRQNVEDDPNWDLSDALVLHLGDGAIGGFALTRRFRLPERYPAMAPIFDLGWIMALVVAPELRGRGFGGQLLMMAEDHLRRGGAARCDLGGSVGHLLPGPPDDDEHALNFWRRHGYQPARLVRDLYRSLDDWPAMSAPAAGWRIVPGEAGQERALLSFLGRTFPGRWHYHLADSLARGARIEDVTLLLDPAGEVTGFAATWPTDSPLLGPATHWFPALGPRFGGVGPLGIAPRARGHGLGLALVAAAVASLRDRGVRDCAIDWTELIDFYARLGFQPWRGYWRCQPKLL